MEQGDVDKLFDDLLRQLSEAGASMRCSELTKILEQFGFVVRDGRLGGHKLYSHPGIPGFTGGSFNCGHGRNPEIKRSYIRDARKIVEEFRDEIKDYLRKVRR